MNVEIVVYLDEAGDIVWDAWERQGSSYGTDKKIGGNYIRYQTVNRALAAARRMAKSRGWTIVLEIIAVED